MCVCVCVCAVNMCPAHIKPSIFENIFSEIEKAVNTFSISKKTFPKMINYCVPLGHTLAKSYIYIYIYIYRQVT